MGKKRNMDREKNRYSIPDYETTDKVKKDSSRRRNKRKRDDYYADDDDDE